MAEATLAPVKHYRLNAGQHFQADPDAPMVDVPNANPPRQKPATSKYTPGMKVPSRLDLVKRHGDKFSYLESPDDGAKDAEIEALKARIRELEGVRKADEKEQAPHLLGAMDADPVQRVCSDEDLNDMPAADLREVAKVEGIDVGPATSKSQLLAAIRRGRGTVH